MKKLFKDDPFFTFWTGFCTGLLLFGLVGWATWTWGGTTWRITPDGAMVFYDDLIPERYIDGDVTPFYGADLESRIEALEERVKKLEENRIHIDLGSGVTLQLEWIKEDPKIQYNLEGCR